jgi:hypothetical protein
MRLSFWRQVGRDFSRIVAYLAGDAVRIIGSLILLILLAIGFGYLASINWWLSPVTLQISRLSIAFVVLALFVAFWFGSAFTRSRQPVLTASNLKGDSVSSVFQMRVENKGPGYVKPIVTVVYLRDLQGNHLEYEIQGFKGPLAISYAGYEAFWRNCGAGKRPVLTEAHPLYASPLVAVGPELQAHNLNGDTEPLRASGLRVQVTITYEPKVTGVAPPVTKHSYVLTRSEKGRLGYKVTRVRFRSLFWR